METMETMIAPVTSHKIYSRALESVLWGMPIVSVCAMREAFFRDAKAKYGDILYWSKVADWKFQVTTPNASSYYVYFNFNTFEGPVVLDFPAATEATLFGSLLDAWQKPVIDVGTAGEDRGDGGRYLLLPPRYHQKIPFDYIPVKLETYNGYAAFRIIPKSSSEEDREKAMELVKAMKVYLLSRANNPPVQKHIDMSGKMFDGIVLFDESFYDQLAEMVNEEPVQTRDLVAMTQLRSIGIEKGKPFHPDLAIREVLKKAIVEAHSILITEVIHRVEPFWEGTHWGLNIATAAKTNFSFVTSDGFYDIDERAMAFFMACAPPKKLGAATFYLGEMVDSKGNTFDGSKNYHLHIPGAVPVKQYWSVTAYDLESAAFIRNAPVLAVDSYSQNVHKNPDGSVDVFFGPESPLGMRWNWIYTEPGKPWFTFFRFYGPDKSLFDKTWKMDDIKEVE